MELYLGEASKNLWTLPGTPVSIVTRLVVIVNQTNWPHEPINQLVVYICSISTDKDTIFPAIIPALARLDIGARLEEYIIITNAMIPTWFDPAWITSLLLCYIWNSTTTSV